MPRKHIYFTEDTLEELQKFVRKEYGNHRAMSLVVQKAVKQFLEREVSYATKRNRETT